MINGTVSSQKNSVQQQTSKVAITSQHYINSLDTAIVQLARAFSIEHGVPIDPDAKEMVRRIVQQRANQLLNDKQVEHIKNVNKDNSAAIKLGTSIPSTYNLYEIINLVGLNDL